MNAKKCPGQNKLRKYKLFKTEYGTEEYVNIWGIAHQDRQAFAQIRCSAAPIRVEVGRFEYGGYIHVDERMWQICNEGVEDELHILLQCHYIVKCRCLCLTKQMS